MGEGLSPQSEGACLCCGEAGKRETRKSAGDDGKGRSYSTKGVGEGHAQFRMLRRLKCTKKAVSEHAPRENLNLSQLSSSSEMDRNTSKTVIL